jgi:hypothetical protein
MDAEFIRSRTSWGGQARAIFWETQDWANLERARYARILRRRHWPEEPYLHEFMADLSAELSPPKRKKTKRHK